MDASTITVGLLLLCLGLSTQTPQDLEAPNVANDNQNTSGSGIKCTTAKGVPGSCVDRQYCDYSTYAIDLSLYAPKWYKKPCAENESCCPLSYQIQIDETPRTRRNRVPTVDNEANDSKLPS